jgi:hypothetical protein
VNKGPWTPSHIFISPGWCSLAIGVSVILGMAAVAFLTDTTASDRRLTELCPTEYRFEPKKDITAFDLARIMAQVSGPWIPRHICVSPSHPIPKDLMRQFKQVTP